MITTFGKMPTSLPAGFSKAVRFPVLAMLDKQTGDHRLLNGMGGGVREQAGPLTIRTQPAAGEYGHVGAIPSGALFEVTIDTDTGVMSGRGFLLDDEMGLKTAYYVSTGAMNKNSVDLADTKVLYVEDFDSEEWWIEFNKWNLAATTFVATPAFAEAHAVIDDEITAALMVDPMEELVASFTSTDVIILGLPELEVTADGAVKPRRDDFFVPEAAVPTKSTVTEDGLCYGHLALWDSCHDGLAGQCLRVPRPSDAYASFNKPGVLTDAGMVDTGPIFAFGGHRPSKSAPTIEQAYGGIENAWADVRVIEGALGPWFSGRVRPGVDEATLYAARASRLSGHWVGGRLKAIVSVNAEGYDVPGLVGGERDLVAGFSAQISDDGVSELVASFPGCLDAAAPQPTVLGITKMEVTAEQLDQAVRRMMSSGVYRDDLGSPVQVDQQAAEEEMGPELLYPKARLALALLLEEDD